MTIQVSARGTTIRDSFRNSLEKKLSKLDRFFGDEQLAKATVTNEGGRETVEITISANGMFFRAEKTTEDRLDSLDLVVDALFRQIVKNKTKLEKRLHKSAFTADFASDYVGTDIAEYKVVRSKRFSLKPMDVDEAILQMNMVGHEFYMFRNSETEEVNVVYRRNDGNYGIIEPDAE